MRMVTPNDATSTCNVCSKVFANKNRLQEHMKAKEMDSNHRGCARGPYRCAECGKTFVQDSSLKQHQKIKHGNPDSNTLKASLDKKKLISTDTTLVSTTCNVCFKVFATKNQMKGHMKDTDHGLEPRKRDVACPLCRVKKFKSSSGAVAHVESGSCTNCQGKDKARQAVFGFVCAKKGAQGMLAQPAQLQFGGLPGGAKGPVPDSPYRCAECGKTFGQVSSMMQHQQSKHGNTATLKAIGF